MYLNRWIIDGEADVLTRILKSLLVLSLAAGSVAVIQTPAHAAAGACATGGNSTIRACVNYGDSGANIRADFYLLVPATSYIHTYRVSINVNGAWYNLGGGTFGGTGRYCCWYKSWTNLPQITNRAYTRIYIFKADGILNYTVSSPTITFVA
jgi:hypothetical protein